MAPVRIVSEKLKRLRAAASEVTTSTGKGMFEQLREMAALRLSANGLLLSDYYAYELYDDGLYTPEGRRAVVGWDSSRVSGPLNDPHWRAVSADKLVFYAFIRGLGLPHPKALAVYDRAGRTFGDVSSIRSPQRMAAFLRAEMQYPFFGKPVDGQHGAGASAVRSIDHARDTVQMTGGEETSVIEYVERFVEPSSSGYIFQELLQPHPLVRKLFGPTVSTVRVIILNSDPVPVLFRVLWRIPVGGNITDNFLHGSSGNLMGFVDPATGVVQRVVRGPGKGAAGIYGKGRRGIQVNVHPETGERIDGFQIPGWQDVRATCLHSAKAFPGLRYQSWDVAITTSGPVIVELNSNGDLMQMPGCPGFYDMEFRRFSASYSREDPQSLVTSLMRRLGSPFKRALG